MSSLQEIEAYSGRRDRAKAGSQWAGGSIGALLGGAGGAGFGAVPGLAVGGFVGGKAYDWASKLPWLDKWLGPKPEEVMKKLEANPIDEKTFIQALAIKTGSGTVDIAEFLNDALSATKLSEKELTMLRFDEADLRDAARNPGEGAPPLSSGDINAVVNILKDKDMLMADTVARQVKKYATGEKGALKTVKHLGNPDAWTS